MALRNIPQSRHNPRLNVSTKLRIALGILLLGSMMLLDSLQAIKITNSATIAHQYDSQHEATFPRTVSIPDVGIDIPILQGRITSGVWQLSDTTALHLNSSNHPGESGNVVIYAHKRPGLFSNLYQAQPGTLVSIMTVQGNQRVYRVASVTSVSPTDLSVVAPTNHEVLTLYTCSGALDTTRLVVKAYPINRSI